MGTLTNQYAGDVVWQKRPVDLAPDNHVHLYRLQISQNLHLLDDFTALLTPGELRRAGRYHQQKDNTRFKLGRGALRYLLGKYLHAAPGAIEFTHGPNGKPYISGFAEAIYFNVSYSADWILLAIAVSPVGVDVELIQPDFGYQDILTEHFSPAESQWVNNPERFFTLWTRKEAFLKATGQGITQHLKIAPVTNGTHTLHTSLAPADSHWQMTSFNLQTNYMAAVATLRSVGNYKYFEF